MSRAKASPASPVVDLIYIERFRRKEGREIKAITVREIWDEEISKRNG
jgi:hypothetical protein